MSNKITIVAVILIVVCLGIAVQTNIKAGKINKDLIQERYSRMEAEEKLLNAQTRIKSLQSDIINAQNQTQGIQAVLEKEKVTAANLKAELDKILDDNGRLEQELKEYTSKSQGSSREPLPAQLPPQGP